MLLKISKRNGALFIIQILLIIVSIAVLSPFINQSDFNKYIIISKIGLFIIISECVILWRTQRKIISGMNFVFVSFVLFQFGLPIMYAVFPQYNNYYISLFSNEILVNGAILTIISTEMFALGIICNNLTINSVPKRSKSKFTNPWWLDKSKRVSQAAMIMFLLTGIIAIPITIYAAIYTVRNGFAGRTMRQFLSSNGIFNFVYTYFFAAGILFLCFEISERKRNIVVCILMFFCVLLLVCADRTVGLIGLLVLLYYKTDVEKAENTKKIFRYSVFSLGFVFILVIGVYIAQSRISTSDISISDIVQNGIFDSIFGEMGFNFTTICFMMKYIPERMNFQYGLAYLYAFVCLIPKSFDPTGVISNMYNLQPAIKIALCNKEEYGELLDFGVGCSLIGEAYYNFNWAGSLILIFLGIIISKFLVKDIKKCNNFEKYMQLILLFGFMTVSRRSLGEILKIFEYHILFMYLYICVFCKIKNSIC